MARSGINSLEQIVAARMNLTASMYHHHKIRACDCMLKGVFLYCMEKDVQLCGRKIEGAADFLHLTDVAILAEAERATEPSVREMLSNIVNRRLFKRALVVSMNSFERPGYEEESNEDADGKYNLVHELIGATLQEHRELAVAIWEAAGKPGRKEEVWLDFPKGVKSQDLATTFVNVGRMNAPVFRTLDKFIPIEQWRKQYLLQKWRGTCSAGRNTRRRYREQRLTYCHRDTRSGLTTTHGPCATSIPCPPLRLSPQLSQEQKRKRRRKRRSK